MICRKCEIYTIVTESAKDKTACYRERKCPVCGRLFYTVEREESGVYDRLRYLRNRAQNECKERRRNESRKFDDRERL